MSEHDFSYRAERVGDGPIIEALLDRAFGPGRRALTAYRLREGSEPVAGLGVVAERNERLAGTVRFWPVVIGAVSEALLLGPLAIDPKYHNQGCGVGLMRRGIALAAGQGHRLIILVGDLPYYARVGFGRVPEGQITLPGPVDPNRLLALELVPGALRGAEGVAMIPIRAADDVDAKVSA